MKVATVSSKGQITIPKDIQNRLHMQTNSKVMLYPEQDFLVIKPLQQSIVDQTAGSLAQYVSPAKKGKLFADILHETQKATAKSLIK